MYRQPARINAAGPATQARPVASRLDARLWLAALAALLSAALSACHAPMTAPGTDGGLVTQHQLSLGFALGAPSLPGLQIAGGTLQLGHLSVFGDVAADSRTTLSNLALALPMDRRDLTFPDAPYGLYSRVQAGPLDLHLKGSWRGTPLEIEVEGVDPGLDLRGPALDYSPEQSAHFGILIDTTVWFDAQALDDATVSFGKIRVEDGQNAGLGALFRANLRASFSLDPAAAAL